MYLVLNENSVPCKCAKKCGRIALFLTRNHKPVVFRHKSWAENYSGIGPVIRLNPYLQDYYRININDLSTFSPDDHC